MDTSLTKFTSFTQEINQEVSGFDIPLLISIVNDVIGQVAESSRRIYLNDIKAFVRWMVDEELTPITVERSDMIAYHAHVRETYKSQATMQRVWTIAGRLLSEYRIAKKIQGDPTEGLKGFNPDDESTHVALTKQQARELLDAVDKSTKKGKRDYALFLILLKTGLRRSECAKLRIGDLAMEQGHHIAYVQGKGDKRKIVKVRVDVFRAIQEYLEAVCRLNASPDAPIFVGFDRGDHPTEQGLSPKMIEVLVKEYAERLRIPHLTPHGLRATFITIALEEGASLHQVQYAARHKDPRTTERYQKRKLNLDDNAVDKLNF